MAGRSGDGRVFQAVFIGLIVAMTIAAFTVVVRLAHLGDAGSGAGELVSDGVEVGDGGAVSQDQGSVEDEGSLEDTDLPGALDDGQEAQETLADPPVPIPEDWICTGYETSGAAGVWTVSAPLAIDDAATEILLAMESNGFVLVDSFYMDLAGDNWGCAAALPDGTGAVVVVATSIDTSGGNLSTALNMSTEVRMVRYGTEEIVEIVEASGG